MTDQNSGTRSSVGLLDIVSQVPGLILDAPVIARGVLTGFLAWLESGPPGRYSFRQAS